MSYLFHALMICFPTIYIRSTQHYKPQNATVTQCQIICLQSIEPYKLLVSLNDSQASNYNPLRKESTHRHSPSIHQVAYIFPSLWHNVHNSSSGVTDVYIQSGNISRHLILLLLSLNPYVNQLYTSLFLYLLKVLHQVSPRCCNFK